MPLIYPYTSPALSPVLLYTELAPKLTVTTHVNAKYYLIYILFTIIKLSQHRFFLFCYQKLGMYRIPLSSKILLDNISVFEIGETDVKTLEWELKSCLTGLTSCPFIRRLPDLFQFHLNQWKHIHVLFKFQLYIA